METIIATIFVLVVLFFLFREVMCWYYKINDIIKLQERQVQIQLSTLMLIEKLVNISNDTYNDASKVTITSSEIKTNITAPEIKTSKEVNGIKDLEKTNGYSPVPDIMDKLTSDEKNVVFSKMAFLKEKELIIINPVSRIIKTVHQTEFKPGAGYIIVKIFER